jgi:glycosyltransferase involved in cell wall biosynthesis
MKKRLKIMQITHDLGLGGLQQVVLNLCKTINREIFDVSILCLRKEGVFRNIAEEMGVKVFTLEQNERIDYFLFNKVAKVLKDQKIQIIHTHNTQPLIDGGIGALFSGVKTIIHTDHARRFPDKRRYMFAEWFMSHFVYKIVGVSTHTSSDLIKYEKISPKKIITIPNAIDGSKFSISIDKKQKREMLGINNNGPIIGVGVRLSEQKGLIYLLKAIAKLKKDISNLNLIIAGEGPLEPSLKIEAKNYGITENVHFVGLRHDMNELLNLFDIYVLPSLWEGLPMVLLEAMAAGCPIIATDVGGVNNAVKNDYNGILVKSGDSNALYFKIKEMLADEKKRDRYSKNGKILFDKYFSIRTMTEKYEKLYLRKT